MADDERRAEIEAARKRISEGNVDGAGWAEAVAVVARHECAIPDRAVTAAINTFVTYREVSGEYGAMRLALAAADRVRDARGDDEVENFAKTHHAINCTYPWESATEDHREAWRKYARENLGKAARAPQSEDHEADVGRIVRFLVDAGCDAAAAMVEIEFGGGHESA